MDPMFYASALICGILLVFVILSYVMTLNPAALQNKSLIGLVLFTSIATGIVGWGFATWGLKGNPNAQIQFLLMFVMILFATSLVSSTLSASQLYGLRDTVAANTQTVA